MRNRRICGVCGGKAVVETTDEGGHGISLCERDSKYVGRRKDHRPIADPDTREDTT